MIKFSVQLKTSDHLIAVADPGKGRGGPTPLFLDQTEARRAEKYIGEIKIHVYGKPLTSDSSWEFLKIENKKIKTVQNNSYG